MVVVIEIVLVKWLCTSLDIYQSDALFQITNLKLSYFNEPVIRVSAKRFLAINIEGVHGIVLFFKYRLIYLIYLISYNISKTGVSSGASGRQVFTS